MLLFSATFKETVRAFATQIVSNPIMIKLREEELTLSNIRQYFFVCRSWEEKYRALCNIYGSITIGQAMIFCQVKHLSLPGETDTFAVSDKRNNSLLPYGRGGLLPRPSKSRSGPQGGVGNTLPAFKGQPCGRGSL